MTCSVLVLYYSRHGSVAALAEKIASGIQQAGAEAKVRCIAGFDKTSVPKHPVAELAELRECDGLAFGSPVRFGNMAAEAKAFWDSTSSCWLKGELINKAAGVFTSSGSLHGGNEANLLSMMLPLLHHGMVLMGVPYSEPELHKTQSGGTPYGPSHVSGLNHDTQLSVDEQRLALAFGKRLGQLSIALKNKGFTS
ncbi:NAD(P)H:quinone oxidoreductase [Alishewanella sp. 16-MA]|uniref:NAD(P)H:quinone oxidoreductase n=1 Tax=Alishewanella maricola TaxID=2795740 RepID=A0ABS8C573_9ALTE|nr:MULTISPECIES: NAD(P)H:quinone oxidoreductase [Gammaproteobacteria]MDP4946238.1 NAD(P)H:quinone oxidoreductase [Alishewanella sp.]MDP5207705.1 NAD(P)H:quinone oxidoreductase [Alishewanella sp. SMS9]MCB5227479.1 NAD(P)H:quinone oxidoreductase [Alishewanella maricola]MCF4009784.1 NAD(P)H:quinone oxidoreductase [Rheinheimera sp. UJ63]MDP5034801.1 NAD(P)H:quinone oxidoreductase [Alishewanella sp.]